MKVNAISANYSIYQQKQPITNTIKTQQSDSTQKYIKWFDCVNFTANSRRIEDIGYYEYTNKLSPARKQFLRKKCQNFAKNVDTENLVDKNSKYLPLMDDEVMEQYIDVCDFYRSLRNEPIICLGRSPKWFLDTTKWMKDGIENYKFVAFSDYWHKMDEYGNPVVMSWKAPTEQEKKAYKSYLNTNRATPKHIVDLYNKTGKKVIITDYVESGKGACSFLDLMAEFAEEDGILEEFANAIRIVAIGCMEYRERFYHEDENISIPQVPMPDRLCKYSRVIEQQYKDMPLKVFEQMLYNQNTNECRSSYYPPRAWTIYKPYNYKTGKMSDDKISKLKAKSLDKSLVNFNPTMRDYRNLLNFRILDYLAQHDLLKESLPSDWWN